MRWILNSIIPIKTVKLKIDKSYTSRKEKRSGERKNNQYEFLIFQSDDSDQG
jgi:hypothetical protein